MRNSPSKLRNVIVLAAFLVFLVSTNAAVLALSVSVLSPPNNTKTNDNTPDIIALFNSNSAPTGQMTLFFNMINVSYNDTAANNTATTLTASTTSDGNYTFWANVSAENPTAQSLLYSILIDTVPPSDIPDLNESTTGPTWIQWNWTQDVTLGFDHYEIWLNQTFKENKSTHNYNATGLSSSTIYELEVRPVDDVGNIGNWSNDTAQTTAPQGGGGGGGGFGGGALSLVLSFRAKRKDKHSSCFSKNTSV